MTMPSSIGTAPPERLVPLPRAMNGTRRVMTQPDDLDDLVAGFRQDDRARPRAEGRQAVGFVRRQRAGMRQQSLGGKPSGECVEQAV